jgi:hypothetical protein
MARAIAFCPPQVYQTGTWHSEIFDVTDLAQLAVEFRVTAVSGLGLASFTGFIESTMDTSFTAWRPIATLPEAATGILTGTYSGLGQFARARLVVPSNSYITAFIMAVGRES